MSATVLVVDDDRITRLLSRRVLERGGYEVIEGVDGEDGADLAASLRPALAIFDWEMPGLSGVDACRRLRSDPALPGMVLVVMSGHSDQAYRQEALDAGADEYLVKPVEPRALLERVGALLGASPA